MNVIHKKLVAEISW